VPARSGPIRNKAVPASLHSTRDAGLSVGGIVDESVKTAMRAVEAADATVRGAVERGVDTAYMVIEEYMLRGRQAAGRNHERRNGRHEMNDERQGSSGSANGAFGGPWAAMNPMMGPWMQMMRMWTDSMTSFMPGANGIASEWMSQFMPGAPMWGGMGASRACVAVQVASPYPVEVKADFDSGAEYSVLTADALELAGGGETSLAATLTCSPGLVKIGITVPEGQAGGRYSGAVKDASGIKRGEITVDVDAPAARARPAAKKRASKRRSAKKG